MIGISRQLRRRIGVVSAGLALLATAACGFNVQTLQPYTPSEGVNTNVGPASTQLPVDSTVLVRGLMIISRTNGSGFLSASLQCGASDQLTAVSGAVVKPDGSLGSPLTVTLPGPVPVAGNQLVVLTDGTEIPVTAGDLVAGGNVRLTLTFANAGSTQILTPVVDGNLPNYVSVSPSPVASASSSPSSSPS